MHEIKFPEILIDEDPDPPYIVENLVYNGQIVLLAGDPGVGKSFLAYHLAFSMACNLGWLHLRCLPVKILYFDEENSRPDLHQYMRRIWRGLGQPAISGLTERLHVEHFALSGQGANRFQYMAEVSARIQPRLIVVDTVTPVCGIIDENDNGEASRAMRALRRVKEVAGPHCAMILLKHAKFSHDPAERQTIRGAKAWLGEADGVIFQKLVQGKPRADGLKNVRLFPDKVRAYGLRHPIDIHPEWCGHDPKKGIILNSLKP